MPPPQKPKELLQLVDTSSQVRSEMAEASLEGILTSGSPIARTCRSGSITPPANAMELQGKCQQSLPGATDSSACQAALYTSPAELKSALVASYHILLGQTPPSPPFILSQRASPVEEQPASAAPPTPVPKQSP